MKKLFAVLVSFTFVLSLFFVKADAASTETVSPAAQVGYVKRKSKKVYYRSKSGAKVVGRKTVKGTRWTAHKTKRGTKKAYVKTKKTTKRTYSKTKDAVNN